MPLEQTARLRLLELLVPLAVARLVASVEAVVAVTLLLALL